MNSWWTQQSCDCVPNSWSSGLVKVMCAWTVFLLQSLDAAHMAKRRSFTGASCQLKPLTAFTKALVKESLARFVSNIKTSPFICVRTTVLTAKSNIQRCFLSQVISVSERWAQWANRLFELVCEAIFKLYSWKHPPKQLNGDILK